MPFRNRGGFSARAIDVVLSPLSPFDLKSIYLRAIQVCPARAIFLSHSELVTNMPMSGRYNV